MKKIYTYILLLASAILFIGCQKDFDGVLTAEIEGYRGDSKVYLDPDNYASWHDGDKVYVNNQEGTISIENDIATISGINDADSYTAVYPLSFAVESNNKLAIPSTQKYRVQASPAGGDYQVLDAPMVAVSKGHILKFMNVGSLMAINITGANGKLIRKIKVTAEGGANLSGTATYQYTTTNTEPTITSWGQDARNTVTLDLSGADVEMTSDNKTFYIAIPPVENAIFTVSVVFEEESGWFTAGGIKFNEVKANKAISIGRSMLLSLDINLSQNNKDYTLTGDGTAESPYEMSSAIDLEVIGATCTRSNGYHQNTVFTQTEDITITEPSNIKNFKGTYDGGGHTIQNNSNNGVFQSLADGATVKNLNVDAQIVNNTENVGGVIANTTSNNVLIENCNVTGSIEIKDSPFLQGNIAGGIVGKQTGNSGNLVIHKCVNHAKVIGKTNAGGIIGVADGTVIVNCANHGDIDGAESVNVLKLAGGGICGLVKNQTIIFNCYSDGNVITGSGIVGLSLDQDVAINNVYVGGTVSSKWIIGGFDYGGNGVTSESNKLFRPNDNRYADGKSVTSEKFNINTWKTYDSEGVESTSLLDRLKDKDDDKLDKITVISLDNKTFSKEAWVDGGNGKPMLQFEVSAGQVPSTNP